MLGPLGNRLRLFLGNSWRTLRTTWGGWCEHDGLLLSAAMAYYAAFSLLPLCLVLIAVLGFVMRLSARAEDARQQLLEVVGRNGGPWLADQLQALLAGVKSSATLGGPIGVITLLVAAIGVFLQLDAMFDKIWGTARSGQTTWLGYLRTVLLGRLTAFIMLLAVGALLIASLLTDVVLTAVRIQVEQFPGGEAVSHWSQTGTTLLVNAILFGLLYKALPKAPVRWRHALSGGVLASLIWYVGQRLLVALVIGKGYTAYGLVGSFMAVMLWLYYASATVFLGAEFVRALGGEKRSV
jgi:membrane protein